MKNQKNKQRNISVKQHRFNLCIVIVFSFAMFGYLMVEIEKYASSFDVYIADPVEIKISVVSKEFGEKTKVDLPEETKKKIS